LSSALPRFAAFDVGSNTLKTTIVEKDQGGGFLQIVDSAQVTRLGEGMHGGRLREAAIRRSLEVLADAIALCRRNRVERVAAVATAAVREAINGDEFVSRAREVGVPLECISGEEEARLSYMAVRHDPIWRGATGLLVIDVGGRSTELIVGAAVGDHPEARFSVTLGAVRLTEEGLGSDPPTIAQLAEANGLAAKKLSEIDLAPGVYRAVGVGGTIVNLASVARGLVVRDPERLHGDRLTLEEIERQIGLYSGMTIAERKRIRGLDPARADIILGGAIALCQALARAKAEEIAVSCRGLRWGLIYDRFGGMDD
jgi:exopolyphosphatase/guanosine-5'-triphosphate,3'-diphosphate pyrophosphatase